MYFAHISEQTATFAVNISNSFVFYQRGWKCLQRGTHSPYIKQIRFVFKGVSKTVPVHAIKACVGVEVQLQHPFLTPTALTPGSHRYALKTRLGGPQSWSGRFRGEIYLFSLPLIELRFLERPALAEPTHCSAYGVLAPTTYVDSRQDQCQIWFKFRSQCHNLLTQIASRSNKTTSINRSIYYSRTRL
jgi:hypothetical protein